MPAIHPYRCWTDYDCLNFRQIRPEQNSRYHLPDWGAGRATNYIGFIRRALAKNGYGQIPVISLSVQGIEKNEGFKFTPALFSSCLQGVIYGDLFMRVLYRVRPYEKVKGSANHLHEVWKKALY